MAARRTAQRKFFNLEPRTVQRNRKSAAHRTGQRGKNLNNRAARSVAQGLQRTASRRAKKVTLLGSMVDAAAVDI